MPNGSDPEEAGVFVLVLVLVLLPHSELEEGAEGGGEAEVGLADAFGVAFCARKNEYAAETGGCCTTGSMDC